MVPPWRGIHFPCAFNDDTKPCKNHVSYEFPIISNDINWFFR